MKNRTISNGQTVKPGSTPQKPENKKLPRRGFIYQVEFCPNPDCIRINTRTRFPEIDDHGLDLRTVVKNANKPGWGIKGKIHPFYKDLAKIHGLKSASDTDGYSLQCLKVNSLFNWEDILPKILKAIQVHVAKKRKMVPAGPAKRPTPEELSSLRREMDFFGM
ncbi:hypothetical protein KGQ27_02205 [Patescibacteria group bacterium]|nr:hypothetical protein [Patescibacteria group bacterium]MDE1946269.1 hypothetical protein [Patescibacteria group bacterium]MDE2010721.1 hypothetical protein [Patescibacteria group bacterium]MDE2232605.1 hypothetical protein [Patescibacteria group bacterium]